MYVAHSLTSVWDKRHFQERSYHGRDITRLVVSQSMPLANHQTVHGYSHVSIAVNKGTHTHTHKHTPDDEQSDTVEMHADFLLNKRAITTT